MASKRWKTFKSKVKGLEDAIFQIWAVKHAAQFTKVLEETAKYIQKKYNCNIAKMIKDVECPLFKFPKCPVPWVITYVDGMMTQEKIDKMDIYVWKMDYELIQSQKADFTEKEKRVFLIILDQCSPSLRLQLEGTKTFEEMCKKNKIVELLKLIQSFCCKHDQNAINIMWFSTAFEHCSSIFKKATRLMTNN